MTNTTDIGPMTSTATTTPAKRVTRAELDFRVTEIYRLLLVGLQRHDIVRFVAEKTQWGIKTRQIENLIQKATARLEEHSRAVRAVELGRAIDRLHDLYGRANRVQDFRTCLSTQRELNELLGLYAPKQVEHLGADGGPPFIALMPSGPQDLETWSRQCRQEQADRQKIGRASCRERV